MDKIQESNNQTIYNKAQAVDYNFENLYKGREHRRPPWVRIMENETEGEILTTYKMEYLPWAKQIGKTWYDWGTKRSPVSLGHSKG